ncbi:hypothetical protein [Vibrio fluvialis]|uniref:hypothetical protein n=1 Tax=Vibrio fluvialis TaxID=676 RepID=UPI001EEA35F2|nr:hypothetical protein [Vibrio fluvialis]MCG6365113.1 hypothetical protein [Vibrio fluvialis]
MNLDIVNDIQRLLAQTRSIALIVGDEENIGRTTVLDMSNSLWLVVEQIDRASTKLAELIDDNNANKEKASDSEI